MKEGLTITSSEIPNFWELSILNSTTSQSETWEMFSIVHLKEKYCLLKTAADVTGFQTSASPGSFWTAFVIVGSPSPVYRQGYGLRGALAGSVLAQVCPALPVRAYVFVSHRGLIILGSKYMYRFFKEGNKYYKRFGKDKSSLLRQKCKRKCSYIRWSLPGQSVLNPKWCWS